MAPPRHHRTRPWALILAACLLLASVVAMLTVPIYARTSPKLGSFPFFYWYQLLWIPLVAVLSWLAYLLAGNGQRGRGEGTAGHGRPDSGPGGLR